jgi:hypothetical protein
MTIVGVLMVIFSEPIFNFTGALDFVERRSPGNSRTFIKLLGILLIILGILTFSGLWAIIFKPLAGIFFRPL